MDPFGLTVYIAGPMSGVDGWNIPAFAECQSVLEEMGADVVNPADRHVAGLVEEGLLTREEVMAANIIRLVNLCDAVCLLPGWEGSAGAICERLVARQTGKVVFEYEELGDG